VRFDGHSPHRAAKSANLAGGGKRLGEVK